MGFRWCSFSAFLKPYYLREPLKDSPRATVCGGGLAGRHGETLELGLAHHAELSGLASLAAAAVVLIEGWAVCAAVVVAAAVGGGGVAAVLHCRMPPAARSIGSTLRCHPGEKGRAVC